jgi:predicted secreted hydrolase
MDHFYNKLLQSSLHVLILVALLSTAALSAGSAGSDWKQAIGPRPWIFPKDHGSHPEYRTEWWYFTGNLVNHYGARYGYQLTFFRQGIRFKPSIPENSWSIRDLYIAHFAITDISSASFWSAERVSRAGPGLAGARLDGMDVWIFNWFAKMEGTSILLRARNSDMELQLKLTPRKPIVLHGQNGLSKKGQQEGQASYYFSFTDMETRGFIKTPSGGPYAGVKGTSWHDHEFGSNQLTSDQVGWDWFSLHLSDGRDLMIYLLRRKDGSVELASSGTLVEPSGNSRHLKLSDFFVGVLDRWQSQRSGGTYPRRWRIRIPLLEIDLIISSLVSDQELTTMGSTGITYWEGAVEGHGNSMGHKVTCEGYAELTGYAGSLGGIF